MSTALIGETQGRPLTRSNAYPQDSRVPINIDPSTRMELRDLLYQPFMRGVGYSEFINRAVKRAYEEAEEQGVL